MADIWPVRQPDDAREDLLEKRGLTGWKRYVLYPLSAFDVPLYRESLSANDTGRISRKTPLGTEICVSKNLFPIIYV